jgi:hypothetical protein
MLYLQIYKKMFGFNTINMKIHLDNITSCVNIRLVFCI